MYVILANYNMCQTEGAPGGSRPRPKTSPSDRGGHVRLALFAVDRLQDQMVGSLGGARGRARDMAACSCDPAPLLDRAPLSSSLAVPSDSEEESRRATKMLFRKKPIKRYM